MDDKAKKNLINTLKKETGFTIRKCQRLLEEANWDYSKASPKKTINLLSDDAKTSQSTSKKSQTKPIKKVKAKKESDTEEEDPESWTSKVNASVDKKSGKFYYDHAVFSEYCNACEVYKKDPSLVPLLDQIGSGFYTQEEIRLYKASSGKVNADPEEAALSSFNKKHKTNYKSWNELSESYKDFTEKDYIDYKDLINWYRWGKKNNAESLLSLSKSAQKILKDKITALSVITYR